jgi:N6-L-threonylcarbamoyladenine synthase
MPNISLPTTYLDSLDFSFSGIKTAIINLNHKNPDINKADLCASFEKTVTDMLLFNVKRALKELSLNKLVLAGGVSANSYIREAFTHELRNTELYYPEPSLCTDNAAMIAAAGYCKFLNKDFADLHLNGVANLGLAGHL